MVVPKALMDVLVCPRCKGSVKEEGMFLVCGRCGLAYPVLEGRVPDMLSEDAWKLAEARKTGFKHEEKV